MLSLTLGACDNPTEPSRDPCDQGLFFTEPEITTRAGGRHATLLVRVVEP